jgi:hypothetical protein
MNNYLLQQLKAENELRVRETDAKAKERAEALITARRFILSHLPFEMWTSIGVTRDTPVEVVDRDDVRLVAPFTIDEHDITLIFTYRDALRGSCWAGVHVVLQAHDAKAERQSLASPTVSSEPLPLNDDGSEPPAPKDIQAQNERIVAGLILDTMRGVAQRRRQQMAHIRAKIAEFDAGAADWNAGLTRLKNALLAGQAGHINNEYIALKETDCQDLIARIDKALACRAAEDQARADAQETQRQQRKAEQDRQERLVFHQAASVARAYLAQHEAHKAVVLAWAERETARLWMPMKVWRTRYAPAFSAPVHITVTCGNGEAVGNEEDADHAARNVLLASAVLLDDPRRTGAGGIDGNGEHLAVDLFGQLRHILIGALLDAEVIVTDAPRLDVDLPYYRSYHVHYRGGVACVNAHPLALREAITLGEPEPVPPTEPDPWYLVVKANDLQGHRLDEIPPEEIIEWAEAHPVDDHADAPVEPSPIQT